jgi:hypothetical protein
MKPARLLDLCLAGCLALAGCGGSLNDAPAATTLEIRVSTATPELIGGPIHFTILGPHFNRYGALAVAAAPMMSEDLSDIPVGTGYSVTLASDDSRSTCLGGARFDVVEGRQTTVEVVLSCQLLGAKPVVINGDANECPDISSVTGSGSTRVGESITLTAVAIDGDHGPMPLSYTWLTDSGIVGSPHERVTPFTCTKPGIANLVLSVSDGDLPCDQLLGVKVDCLGCSRKSDPAACDAGAPDGAF